MHMCLVLTRHFTAVAVAWIRFGKFTVVRVKMTKNLHTRIDPHLAQVSNRIVTYSSHISLVLKQLKPNLIVQCIRTALTGSNRSMQFVTQLCSDL